MRIKVKYLAVAREITGTREEIIETYISCTLIGLLGLLSEKHGQRMREYLFDRTTGKPHQHLQFLVDGAAIHMMDAFKTMLTDGSTVLIIPPVSGG